ncbi:MAG TPA: ComEC/Rec2 family competence protein [Candidatus Paceibacterota bacterium]|nr:ComEC/Rec2 family competence protein [Candidatus Paceibacterota bacterium]
MKPKIFYAVIFGFLLGNIFGSRVLFSLPTFTFGFILLTAIFSFLLFRFHRNTKEFKSLLLLLIFFSMMALGIMRFVLAENLLQKSELQVYENKTMSMVGVALNEPVRKTDLKRVQIEISAVMDQGEAKKIDPEVIGVYVDFFEPVSYGDVVMLEGELERIKNREEGNFDYVYYSKKDGIQFQVFRPKIRVEKNIGNPVILKLKSFKDFFENILAKYLSEPHSSLVSGMIIAGKGALPQNIQDEFIRTGLIHVVVLSGFNIAIIIKFLSSFLDFLKVGKKVSLVLLVGSLVLFVLMAGATPPVIRAVLMASIVLMGKATFRQMDANKVLLFVAFILAVINPYSVPFDPSFQLSFLATFAVINFTPIFEKFFLRIKNPLLRETVSQTLAATIFVSPFVLYQMGNFSVMAVFVNVLLLPLVPLLMIFGFAVVVSSFIPLLPTLFSFLTVTLSAILFTVVHFASNLPFANFTIENLSIWWIIPIYIALLWFLYKKKNSGIVRDATNPY